MKHTRSTNTLTLPLELLHQGYDINPEATAAEDPFEKINYRELKTRVEALAHGLTSVVQSKQLSDPTTSQARIGLCAQNSVDHLVAHLAILTAGFIWVPINPKNGAVLNQKLIQKSQPTLVLSDSASLSSIPETLIETVLLSHATQEPNCRSLIETFREREFPKKSIKQNDIFGIKFTGGTTGEPKGVIQTHGNVAAVIANMQTVFGFTQKDCNLAVAPLTHGGSHYLFPLLSVGGRQVLLPTPKPEEIIKAFKEQQVSVSFMPPTLIYKLLDQTGISREDFPKLRHLTYSAAPMPPEKITEVINKLGPCLSTVYGQTEAPMTITAMSCNDMQKSELRASVGRACLHSDVAILDAKGQSLPVNTTGEIAVRGAIVMPGYFEDPTTTEEAFNGDWLLTGDLGYLDNQGYLFLQGRSKELIISGGFNVYPAEVENALMTLDDVHECLVFGAEDGYWGERVEAAVCLTPEAKEHLNSQSNVDAAHLETKLKERIKPILGDVKTPKKFYLMDELPRNPVGKVVRRDVKNALLKQCK